MTTIRVLHVDDEPEFADLTADLLERESDRLDIRTETRAEAALAAVRDGEVDCVVSDHDMPRMNGIELLRAVRADDPEIPFILFTGKGSEAVASTAVSAGVTDYLQKESGTEHYTLLANRIENAVDRHRSQRAVERQKRRLETLVSNLPGIVYRCRNDRGWPMEDVGGECRQLSGYDAEAIESGAVSWGRDVIHPDDRGKVWTQVQEALDDGDPFECTYRIETVDGETKWVWERGRGIYGDDGSIEAIEGFITDITGSKRRERRFEAVFDNTYQFMGLIDPNGTIIEVNETALAFGGVERDEVVGRPMWEGVWFQSSDRAVEIAREAVETARGGELFREELEIQGADEEVYVDFSVRPVTDEDGTVTLLIPEARDITSLKERERTLRRNERRFEAIFNDPNLLVALLDADGTTQDVNDTAMEYVDADRSDIVGEPFARTPWWAEIDDDEVQEWIDGAADGEYVEYEATHPTETGDPIAVEGQFRPVTDDDSEVTAIVVSAKDVTARKQQETELKRHNKRLDEFASVVSHDLQTPVSTARGRLELALETGEMDHVDRALKAIDRVDELRTDLVNTLRTGEIVSDTERIAVAPVVEDVWTTIDPPETASITVESEVAVEADPGSLQRMLENLVGNSIDHAGDGVDIRIGPCGDGLYYEDSGPGIDPEHREMVFTPGFSTKGGEEGIGMGLASVRQIALAHGWDIRVVDGDELGGARFEIRTG